MKMYQARRKALQKTLPPQSALVVPSWPEALISWDVEGLYRPSKDMIYLSGFEEPHSALLISSSPSKQVLFTQKKDSKKEVWTGPIYGPDKAGEVFGMDSNYPSSEFCQVASQILKDIKHLYYSFGINPKWDQKVNKVIQNLKQENKLAPCLHDSLRLIAPLRMQKSKPEIALIKKAVEISTLAHIEVMKNTKPGVSEGALHGLFLYEIKKRGAHQEAYPGIFASGLNGCTLHYIANRRQTLKGEMLLVDAGAEYKHYASDITRTYPISGKFSATQKKLYTKLLNIQKKMIKSLKPGLSFRTIQKTLVKELSILMLEQGFLKGKLQDIIQTTKYKKYFPHTFGHLLGLDVHDVAFTDTKDIELKQGFTLTMEPGLYFPPEDMSLPKEVRGLAFRIEDDILITNQAHEVLSHKVPKEVEEIEKVMSTKP